MITRQAIVPPGSGLHARPATELVEAIVASGLPVRVGRPGAASVDGRSVLRVLGLGLAGGEIAELTLDTGEDDAAAVAALDRLAALVTRETAPASGRTLTGRSAARGAAAGIVYRIADRVGLDAPGVAEPAADAAARARAAFAAVEADLRARADHTSGSPREVLLAGAAIAADPDLHAETDRLTAAGRTAAQAIVAAAEAFRATLVTTRGALAERVADLDDVRDRALAACLDLPLPGLPDRREPYVLVARELAPADAALLDPAVVVAIVTAGGGPTGHTAILARELGIPAVVGCAGAEALATGTHVAVLASEGTVVVDPDPDRLAALAAGAARTSASAGGSGVTADGHRVALLVNLGDAHRAAAARAAGAEGVGLLRTEFCFAGRATAPTVDEQVTAYAEVARAFAGARVVIRLLDAGADKPLPFLDAAAEPNPALGVRGLRALRAAPEVLRDQLAAIAAVAATGEAEVWTMAPMVATAAEARWFARRARDAGLSHVGVMVEVPAAALGAEAVLAPLDFASLGTNDLAQYTFAADRGLGHLAGLQDPWHPALLRLVELTASAGAAAGKPVGVCGEAAGDPDLAPVLVGLGVTSLSMAVGSISDVRARLAAVTLAQCRDAARLALAADGAEEAHGIALAALAG